VAPMYKIKNKPIMIKKVFLSSRVFSSNRLIRKAKPRINIAMSNASHIFLSH